MCLMPSIPLTKAKDRLCELKALNFGIKLTPTTGHQLILRQRTTVLRGNTPTHHAPLYNHCWKEISVI